MRANNRNKLPIPGQVYTLFALGSTVLALAAVKFVPGVEASARGFYRAAQIELNQTDDPLSRDDPRYNDARFAGMNYKTRTAGQGDGFDNLSTEVNKGADISSDGVVAEERRYLRHQLEARTGRAQLWPGDKLDVPVVPVPTENPKDS